ncbi:MAG: hypothetical protein R3C01_08030 [Planctomycetaceae bacterium]
MTTSLPHQMYQQFLVFRKEYGLFAVGRLVGLVLVIGIFCWGSQVSFGDGGTMAAISLGIAVSSYTWRWLILRYSHIIHFILPLNYALIGIPIMFWRKRMVQLIGAFPSFRYAFIAALTVQTIVWFWTAETPEESE